MSETTPKLTKIYIWSTKGIGEVEVEIGEDGWAKEPKNHWGWKCSPENYTLTFDEAKIRLKEEVEKKIKANQKQLKRLQMVKEKYKI